MLEDLALFASKSGKLLLAKGLLLTTAESCTGGEVAQVITSIPGSSNWFERGFVTYSNQAKIEMLGVQAQTLASYGAVSEQTVREMAAGALKYSYADLSLAVTGIAGPGGGTAEKPVGMVWFAWAGRNIATQAQVKYFSGDRQSIRDQATFYVLQHLIEILHEGC